MASSTEIDNLTFDSATNSRRTTTAGGGGGTPTVTFVGDGAASATLIAANANRKSVSFYNQSPATLYIKEGGAASIAAGGYSVALETGEYYETTTPAVVHGIWASDAGGYVNITERV